MFIEMTTPHAEPSSARSDMNPEYMPLLRSFGMRAAALAVLVLGAAHANAQPVPSRMSPDDKASYAVGVDMARNLKRQGLDVDLDLMIRGLKDGLSGEKLIIPEKEFRQALINVQTVARRKQAQYRGHSAGEINLKRGEFFLCLFKPVFSSSADDNRIILF